MIPKAETARDPIDSIIASLDDGEAITLATVVGPRGLPAEFLGRKLLYLSDGRVEGSIGAWPVDLRVARECAMQRQNGQTSRLLPIELSANECHDLGLAPGLKLDLFIDLLTPSPSLLIIGGGHIAQPLCTVAKTLGFSVTVMDDRASFANRDRFPEADNIVLGYFEEELARYPIHSSTYIIIVTRGHAYDQASLRAVIGSRAAYIGMIGSAHKVRTVMSNLAEAGVPKEQMEKVYSPIGLDIGAETPAEIAVGIMAEIVNVRRRRQRHAASLSQRPLSRRP
ncbi:MAG TPA: XdhC/CoxI family protein [Chloroflexota bacterium]|nr:XdhC/CoxI family protein [Chloroflexota bacterium]